MTIEEALRIVLELAVNNTVDEKKFPLIYEKQNKATDMVSGLIDAIQPQ